MQTASAAISLHLFFKILFLYFYKEGKARTKRGRKISRYACLSHGPYWGPGPKSRHVPWLRIEPVTLWFASPPSIHRATPARAPSLSIRPGVLITIGGKCWEKASAFASEMWWTQNKLNTTKLYIQESSQKSIEKYFSLL